MDPLSLAARWEAHLVSDSADRAEAIAALLRIPAHLHEDAQTCLSEARSLPDLPLLHFALIPHESATDAELATMQRVVEHSMGERWHRVVGENRMLIRSEERSQSLIKSLFTLLCQVLDERAPSTIFGTLSRIPITGVVWFGYDAKGSDPGVYAVWVAARDEVPEEYHGKLAEPQL